MQVKSIAECSHLEHSATLLLYFKLPFVIKVFFFVYYWVAAKDLFYYIGVY